jgi:membrane-associated phospholipid phosphatase
MGMGFEVVIPWGFWAFIIILPMPLAYALALCGLSLQNLFPQHPLLIKLSGFLTGLLLLFIYRFDSPILLVFWSLSIGYLFVHLIKSRFTTANSIITAFICIGFGFCFISNLNYFALLKAIDRLQDISLYQLDLTIYSRLFGKTINYSGIFALTNSMLLYNIFQNAYSILFFTTFLIFFTVDFIKDSIPNFLLSLLACYLIGIIIFLLYPTVGPFIMYPESFRVEYKSTLTYKTMQTILSGYYAIKKQASSFSGIGYFVSFPSLHVAVALILQYFIRNSLFHFWMLLPISLAVILSTVYLGFHYIIDIPAGVILAFTVVYMVCRLMPTDGGFPPSA